MASTYLYQDDDGTHDLIIDRIEGQKVILRSQQDGYTLPIMKTSSVELAQIFSEIISHSHQQASKLDHDDTKLIIKNVLGDTSIDISTYKPSSMVHYTIYLEPDEDYEYVTLTFKVFYHLWKKDLDATTGNYAFKDIVTDEIEISYALLAERYLYLIEKIGIFDAEEAEAMWNAATHQDFIMDEDYDFGDMDGITYLDDDYALDFGEVSISKRRDL